MIYGNLLALWGNVWIEDWLRELVRVSDGVGEGVAGFGVGGISCLKDGLCLFGSFAAGRVLVDVVVWECRRCSVFRGDAA